MNKILVIPLVIIAIFTLLTFTIEPGDAIVSYNPDGKSVSWDGADYVTTVELTLNDTILDKRTGESTYWFDTIIDSFHLKGDNEVVVNFTISNNALTDLVNAPSLASTKVNYFNTDYSFTGKSLSSDNLSQVQSELTNIPLKSLFGELEAPKTLTVGNTYNITVLLEDYRAGSRHASVKLGSNSYFINVFTQQNWDDNTLSIENMAIEGGVLVMDNGVNDPNWWNPDFLFRVPITVSTTRPDDYPVRIMIENTDLGGELLHENWQSLRFTENIGLGFDAGELDYWIENTNLTGENCIVHVRLPENSDGIIYCYFGNPTPTDNSSAFDVFGYDAGFDSFDGWAEVDGGNSFSVVNSKLEIAGLAGQDNDFVIAHSEELVEWTLDYTYQFDAVSTAHFVMGVSDNLTADGANVPTAIGATTTKGAEHAGYISTWSVGGNIHYWANDGGAYDLAAGTETIAENTTYWGTLQIFDDGGTPTLVGTLWNNIGRNGDNAASGMMATGTNTSANVTLDPMGRIYAISDHLVTNGGNYDGWVDSVIFRQYIATEPTYSFGSLESPSGAGLTRGEWYSTTWELGILSTIDNLVLDMTNDTFDEYVLDAQNADPAGMTVSTLTAYENATWFITDTADDKIYQYYNPNYAPDPWGLISGTPLSDTVTTTKVMYNWLDPAGSFLVLDTDGGDHIDNYNSTFAYVENFPTSTIADIEVFAGEYYTLDSINQQVIVYNSVMVYDRTLSITGLDSNPINAFNFDGSYWYILQGGTRRIYQFDNNFDLIGCIRSVGADDGTPRDILSDGENLYYMGNATDTLYKYSSDNERDNIYARISVDTDNDLIMDENSAWHMMPDNGYWIAPENISNGYNYRVAFKFESENTEVTPKISLFRLNVDLSREWVSVENWADNFTVAPLNWTTVETWLDSFRVTGRAIVPLHDIADMVVNFVLPLFILFMPAISFAKKGGTMGFIFGLMIGTVIAYAAFGFSLGIVILICAVIAVLWVRGNT